MDENAQYRIEYRDAAVFVNGVRGKFVFVPDADQSTETIIRIEPTAVETPRARQEKAQQIVAKALGSRLAPSEAK